MQLSLCQWQCGVWLMTVGGGTVGGWMVWSVGEWISLSVGSLVDAALLMVIFGWL